MKYEIVAALNSMGKRKLLFLIPLLVIILLFVLIRFTDEIVKDILLDVKCTEIEDMLNNYNKLSKTEDIDHIESALTDYISIMDDIPFIYAALVKYDANGIPHILNQRNIEREAYYAPFNALDYVEFNELINQGTSRGNIILEVKTSNIGPHDMHVYFIWASISNSDARYLLISGVSEHSIVEYLDDVIHMPIWLSIFVIFIFTLVMICVTVHHHIVINRLKISLNEYSQKGSK